MIAPRHSSIVAMLALAVLLSTGQQTHAAQPTRFTFTPTFKDPDPGKRQWEKSGNRYVETLPSGRVNTFHVQKEGVVNGLKGTILQKIEEPNFFVFVADSEAAQKQLWWWRDTGPWKFMGIMKDVSAPVRID
jgi:eukaryotic-like serine/threonine-protein kinase